MIWFALMPYPQCERSVERELRERGLRTFLPVEIVYRRARNARGTVKPREAQRLLAPGYLFCEWPVTDHDEIRDVIRIEGVPAMIPHAALEGLLRAHARIAPEHAPRRPIAVGDFVRIATGAYQGLTAPVAQVHKGLAYVTLPILGSQRHVAVRTDLVERVK